MSLYVPPGWSLSLNDKVAGRERKEYDKKVGMSGVFPLNPHCPNWTHNFPTIPTDSPLSPYVPLDWFLSLDDKFAGRERKEYDKKHRDEWGIPTKSPLSQLYPQFRRYSH